MEEPNMLITCPECGKKVSDKAAACPECGCPMEEIRKQFQFFLYDPETMTGKTAADNEAIEVAEDFYGELIASADGRVWNSGGQVVAEWTRK
jgi:endogenous inhibitor of DNA gyrase (YacG/DUF329 family)